MCSHIDLGIGETQDLKFGVERRWWTVNIHKLSCENILGFPPVYSTRIYVDCYVYILWNNL